MGNRYVVLHPPVTTCYRRVLRDPCGRTAPRLGAGWGGDWSRWNQRPRPAQRQGRAGNESRVTGFSPHRLAWITALIDAALASTNLVFGFFDFNAVVLAQGVLVALTIGFALPDKGKGQRNPVLVAFLAWFLVAMFPPLSHSRGKGYQQLPGCSLSFWRPVGLLRKNSNFIRKRA